MVSRLATIFEVVAATIRQCMLRGTACSGWFWVQKGSDRVGVANHASLLRLIDGVTQNILLVASLL